MDAFTELTFFLFPFTHSDSGESYGDSNDLDNILASIKDLNITEDDIRKFLPKVNWEQLASMYVMGHSGAECEARYELYYHAVLSNLQVSIKKIIFYFTYFNFMEFNYTIVW